MCYDFFIPSQNFSYILQTREEQNLLPISTKIILLIESRSGELKTQWNLPIAKEPFSR